MSPPDAPLSRTEAALRAIRLRRAQQALDRLFHSLPLGRRIRTGAFMALKTVLSAYVAYTIGPVTAKVTVNYAPKQKALALDQGQTGLLKKNDNVYLAGDLSAAIPNTPLGLSAHLGHTWGPSWLSLGNEYTDWGAGATLTWKNLVLGVSYVDTDGVFLLANGKNAARSGVVVSLGVSF